MKTSKNTLVHQVKALAIYDFMTTYHELETEIRTCFEQSLENCSPNIKNKLYFYYGGRIGTHINYDSNMLLFDKLTFSENELFKSLSISQILKINKESRYIEKFDKKIDSIQRKMIQFNCNDCLIKLLEMRNVLAHKILDLNFKEKHIIETLTKDRIKENLEMDFNIDSNLLDETLIQIYSNIVYMKIIKEIIKN